MSIQLKGTTNIAEVDDYKSLHNTLKDSKGNKITLAQREKVASTQEYSVIAGKNDDFATAIRTDRKGSLMTGNYTSEFFDQFEGTVLNLNKWNPVTSGFSQAQATLTGLNFTNTASTAAGSYSIITSQRLFQKIPRVPLQLKERLRHSAVTNSVIDFGFGTPITTSLIVPNGVSFRMVTSGSVYGVITYNGVEIAIDTIKAQTEQGSNVIGNPLTMSDASFTSNYYVYDIIIDDDNAVFTIQNTQTGEMVGMLSLPVPVLAAKMIGVTSVPCYYRVYNSAVTTASPIFIETEMQALSLDWNVSVDASQNAANLGLSSGRHPYTGVQLENHTNSTAPVSATLSNTGAGYTTLGGKFQFLAVAGSVTDYCLFGFQVPAGAKFICEGVRIETRNTGVPVATTPTTLEWAIGFNSSAVSLTTPNIIRKQVGVQSFAVGAAVESTATAIDVDFPTPEVVESSRFVHIILTIPVGTATASEIFRGQVLVKGRFM
jgi:hypothetical protein